jgi:hypothetical protein
VNFSAQIASVSFPALTWPGSYVDWFGNSRGSLGVKDVYLRVPAHGYRILVKQ